MRALGTIFYIGGSMHRISLRGPWHLAVFDDRIEASRKFHAPPGFSDDRSVQKSLDDPESRSSVCFNWQASTAWPVDCLRFNEMSIQHENGRVENDLESDFFSWDSEAGVGKIELNGILRRFNEIVLVWRRWPPGWQAEASRYTPDPLHPIHFDSWLEIQT